VVIAEFWIDPAASGRLPSVAGGSEGRIVTATSRFGRATLPQMSATHIRRM
jgi:hypothetical protein